MKMYGLNGAPAEARGPVNWEFATFLVATFIIVILIFSGGYELGYSKGHWDGYTAGYVDSYQNNLPHLPCGGKPNCETLN
jgi:hypothetical protein